MTAARRATARFALLCAITVVAAGCTTDDGAVEAEGPIAPSVSGESEAAEPAATGETDNPAGPSAIRTESPTDTPPTPATTTRTPEEVSDLWPWNQPRPNLDSGTVDPALYATEEGRFNFTVPPKNTVPSGNVQCGIWEGDSPAGQVGCQAVTGYPPIDGPMCTNAENDKYAVRVDNEGGRHFCTTQGIYTTAEPRVLKYGQVLSAAGVVCESDRTIGVICWGTEGAFLFSDDQNTIF